MSNQPFIHLRVHSSYSLASGTMHIAQLCSLAVESNMPAIAITDNYNLIGSLEFSLSATKLGLQPIIGVILKHEKIIPQTPANNIQKNHIDLPEILLIAKNNEGYQNLLKIASYNYLNRETNPHILIDELKSNSTGIIALIGHPKSELSQCLNENKIDEAEQAIELFYNIFQDDLYIELTRHNHQTQMQQEPYLIELAYKHNVPLVATNDVFFSNKEMFEAFDVLSCIASNRYIVETDRVQLNEEYYFKSTEEMHLLFQDIPEAVENTINIAKKCSVILETKSPILPSFTQGVDKDEKDILREESMQGLKNKLKHKFYDNYSEDKIKKYYERIDYELEIIINMNFQGYFLIVSDFIKWAKQENIPVGPGRGSGAGSIIAWVLEITDIDPIHYGLLFERFLNPARVSMPDFDIDFCQEKREKVIEYVEQKYGNSKVAQILTIGKLQAKAVLKDVGRVLQIPYKQVDDICKMIPFNPIAPVTLSQALELDTQLQETYKSDSNIKKLFDISLKLEGLNRHLSTHAAGIIIGDRDLMELVPLYQDHKSNNPVVQYSMKYAELAGLVKFDFLGLKTLTTIDKSVKLIQENDDSDFQISNIDLTDAKTFNLLQLGHTIGVFQLESAGMRDTLQKMQPDHITDIISLISLYRPGPIDNIPLYIARKHKKEGVSYYHDLLEECLAETYGIIIYQEQVMEIAKVLAGYSLAEADLLRRAMGKKIQSEMEIQKQLFIDGCKQNMIDAEKSSEIFELVSKFAGYGFNKSHAAAYTLISYQTAYLKANYPTEFMVSLLNLDINDSDKLNIIIQEIKRLDIPILPPHYQKSTALFSIELNENNVKSIRYAISAIKAVGLTIAKELEKHHHNKKLSNIFDYFIPLDIKAINKKSMENLIFSGFFDDINNNRKTLYNNISIILKYAENMISQKDSNQISLFDIVELKNDANDDDDNKYPPLKEEGNYSKLEQLANEYQAIGFYLNKHPIEYYQDLMKKHKIKLISEVLNSKKSTFKAKIACVVLKIKQRSGKKGRFAQITISDHSGLLDLTIFDSELISANRELLQNGSLILAHISVKYHNSEKRINITKLESLGDLSEKEYNQITITIDNPDDLDILIKMIKESEKNIDELSSLQQFHVKILLKPDNLGEVLINIPALYKLSTENLNQFTTVLHSADEQI